LDLAVHLQRASADDLEALADDLEVVADNGLTRLAGLCAAELRLRAWGGLRIRLERIGLGRATREHGHGYPPGHCPGQDSKECEAGKSTESSGETQFQPRHHVDRGCHPHSLRGGDKFIVTGRSRVYR